jgi:chromosome partitioning protein
MTLSVPVLVVTNRKGGAGKTTVSVNLAAEFAELGKRVLVIDLDSQGHCAVGLGVKVGVGQATIHDVFTESDFSIHAAICETAVKNISLLPAKTTFQHQNSGNDENHLARVLTDKFISEQFDLVIIDTPPSLDNLLLNALCAATWVLVPYVPHPLSFEGVRQLVRVLFKVISEKNPKLKILGFLPVMTAVNVRQHKNVTEQVTKQFGALRVLNGIRTDIKLAEAFAANKPVRFYAPKSRGAEDFANLAATVIALISNEK